VIRLSVGHFDSRGIQFRQDRNVSVLHSDPTGFGLRPALASGYFGLTSAGLIRPGRGLHPQG
jgi:hypothetical protein